MEKLKFRLGSFTIAVALSLSIPAEGSAPLEPLLSEVLKQSTSEEASEPSPSKSTSEEASEPSPSIPYGPSRSIPYGPSHGGSGGFGGFGSIPYVGADIHTLQDVGLIPYGYINMAQEIANGNFGAIPYAGSYLSQAQSLMGDVDSYGYEGAFENYNERLPEYFGSEDGFNRDDMNFLINAQLKHSPSKETILQLKSVQNLQIKNKAEGDRLDAVAKLYGEITNKVKDEKINEARQITKTLLQLIDGGTVEKNVFSALCLYRLGITFKQAGDYEDGGQLQAKALKITDQIFGANNRDYPVCLEYFALIAFQNAFYQDAEYLYIKANNYRAKLGLSTLENVGLLIRCYLIQHRFFEARNYLEQITAKYQQQIVKNEKLEAQALVNVQKAMALKWDNIKKRYPNDFEQRYGRHYGAELQQRLSAARQSLNGGAPILQVTAADVAEMKSHYASVLYYFGYYSKAEQNQAEALALFSDMPETEEVSTYKITFNERLAQIKIRQKKYKEAEKLLDESDQLKTVLYQYKDVPVENASGKAQAQVQNGRSNEPQKVKRTPEELELFFVSGRNIRAQLLSRQGKTQEAVELYSKNLDAVRSQEKFDAFDKAEIYRMRGLLYVKDEKFELALDDFKKASSLLKEVGQSGRQYSAVIDCDMADVYIARQDWEQANEILQDAKDKFENAPADSQVRFHNALAQTYYGLGKTEEGIAELNNAIDFSLEARRNVSINEQARADAFAEYYFLYETLVKWSKETDNVETAYNAMEKSRGLGLQELMKNSEVDPLKGLDKETASKLTNNLTQSRSRLNEKMSQLTFLYSQGSKDEAKIKSLNEEIQQCKEKELEARDNIKEKSVAYQKSMEKSEIVPFEEINEQFVKDNITACEYFVGTKDSFLLVYGANVEKPTLYSLNLDESAIDALNSLIADPNVKLTSGSLTSEKLNAIFNGKKGIINRLAAEPNDSESTDLTEALAELWQILFPDENLRSTILSLSEEDSLCIFPDGALSSFPFETLVVDADSEDCYIIDQPFSALYSPSAKFYTAGLEKNQVAIDSLLTCGHPDYRSTLPSSTSKEGTRGFISRVHLHSLPGMEKEINRIEKCGIEKGIKTRRFDGKETTEENIRKNVEGQKLVHITCQGLTGKSAGNMFGGLAVTEVDKNNPDNDGFITLAEIFDLNMADCQLAILNAYCVNRDANQKGDETQAFGRGMLISGSRRVVITDWSVEDESAANATSLFVQSCLESEPESQVNYSRALKKAKQAIRRNESHPEWSAPYYWAPFVLIGSK